MKRIIIRNGRVIDPANGTDGLNDVYIAEGKIVSVGLTPEGFQADQEIDASNRIVTPGLVDISARLREPGLEHKATIASETRAAAASGITTLCCPPDTSPVIDTPAVAELIRHRAMLSGKSKVVPLGALTRGLEGQQISEMAALKDAGCVGVFNVYPIENTLIQRRSMEYAATHGLTVFLNSEDVWLAHKGCAHEGPISTRLGLPGIPAAAEIAAVARDIALVEQLGVRAHFCRLSTAKAVRMVARAQYEGLPITADVCAHQLFLNEYSIEGYNAYCHVRPPLRSEQDRLGLRQGVTQNVVGAICSDHQPHDADAKQSPFCSTQPGISALETLLPFTLRLAEEEEISLSDAIRRVTSNPASILGIDAGALSIGAAADVCIFDPDQEWVLDKDSMISHGQNTPFLGQTFKGRVTHTLVYGEVVFEL
jgi:dihydroorotase